MKTDKADRKTGLSLGLQLLLTIISLGRIESVTNFVSDVTARFIDAVPRATTREQLRDLLEKALSHLSVTHFTLYQFAGSAEEGVPGNFAIEWGQRYAVERYEYADPVALQLFRCHTTFQCNIKTLELKDTFRGASPEVRHEDHEFSLKEGYAYLIADTLEHMTLTSFCSEKIDRDPTMLPALRCISMFMHVRYKEIISKSQTPDSAPHLTPRERECLRWAAMGKSNWEISRILNIKETTVQTHIENVKRKFDVSTKILAVIRSIQCGAIHV